MVDSDLTPLGGESDRLIFYTSLSEGEAGEAL